MLRLALPFLVAPIAALAVGIATGRADPAELLAVVLVCPSSVQAADCSLDVVARPAGATDCPKVVQVLTTHLDLPAGGYHKLICERRKG